MAVSSSSHQNSNDPTQYVSHWLPWGRNGLVWLWGLLHLPCLALKSSWGHVAFHGHEASARLLPPHGGTTARYSHRDLVIARWGLLWWPHFATRSPPHRELAIKRDRHDLTTVMLGCVLTIARPRQIATIANIFFSLFLIFMLSLLFSFPLYFLFF